MKTRHNSSMSDGRPLTVLPAAPRLPNDVSNEAIVADSSPVIVAGQVHQFARRARVFHSTFSIDRQILRQFAPFVEKIENSSLFPTSRCGKLAAFVLCGRYSKTSNPVARGLQLNFRWHHRFLSARADMLPLISLESFNDAKLRNFLLHRGKSWPSNPADYS